MWHSVGAHLSSVGWAYPPPSPLVLPLRLKTFILGIPGHQMYDRKCQSWIEINITLPWSTDMVNWHGDMVNNKNTADQNPRAYLTQCTSVSGLLLVWIVYECNDLGTICARGIAWEQGYHYCVLLFHRVIIHATQNGTVALTGDEEHVIFLNLLLVFKDYCLTCKPVHIWFPFLSISPSISPFLFPSISSPYHFRWYRVITFFW